MAIAVKKIIKGLTRPHKTSIGRGPYARPVNKHKRRNWKPYVGQGKRQ